MSNHCLKELKEKVYKANMKLFENNLVISTFGNVSGIDRNEGVVAIKPSGVSYVDLTPGKIVLVDLENNVLNSPYNPSTDTKTHTVLYQVFPKIGSVVHTHSPYATAWAQAMNPIPCFGTTQADYVQGEIPCTEELSAGQIMGDYEREIGNQIHKTFMNLSYEEIEMVLVASHGPFTWGKTSEQAVYNSIMLEELAKIAFFTLTIKPTVKNINQTLIDKHFLRKHGKNAYYGQKR